MEYQEIIARLKGNDFEEAFLAVLEIEQLVSKGGLDRFDAVKLIQHDIIDKLIEADSDLFSIFYPGAENGFNTRYNQCLSLMKALWRIDTPDTQNMAFRCVRSADSMWYSEMFDRYGINWYPEKEPHHRSYERAISLGVKHRDYDDYCKSIENPPLWIPNSIKMFLLVASGFLLTALIQPHVLLLIALLSLLFYLGLTSYKKNPEVFVQKLQVLQDRLASYVSANKKTRRLLVIAPILLAISSLFLFRPRQEILPQEEYTEQSINSASHLNSEPEPSPAPTDQEAARSELRSLIGTWEGTYYCSGKPRRLVLLLATIDNQKTAALFKFYPGSQALSDSSQTGSFLMDVSYAHSGLRGRGEIGELQLSAASWVSRPKGYDMVSMGGSVYLAEKRITGRVTGADCGDFELSYVGQQGVDELLSVVNNYQTSTVSQSASSEQPHQAENRHRPTLEICNNAPSNQLLVSVVVTISTNNALSNDRVWEANGWHTIQHLTCKSFLLPEHYAVSSQDVLLYAYNLNRREWADPSGPTICVRNLYGGNGSVWSMRWQGDEPKCPSTGYREAQAHRFGVGTNGGKWIFNTESIGEIPYELIQK